MREQAYAKECVRESDKNVWALFLAIFSLGASSRHASGFEKIYYMHGAVSVPAALARSERLESEKKVTG